MSERNCGTCKYWAGSALLVNMGGGLPLFHCRRYAPELRKRKTYWPETTAVQWCGEWANKYDRIVVAIDPAITDNEATDD